MASHRQIENICQDVVRYHRDSVNRFLAKRTVLLVAPAPHRTCIGERSSQSELMCSTRQCKTKGAIFKRNTEQHPTATRRTLSRQEGIIAWSHTFFSHPPHGHCHCDSAKKYSYLVQRNDKGSFPRLQQVNALDGLRFQSVHDVNHQDGNVTQGGPT